MNQCVFLGKLKSKDLTVSESIEKVVVNAIENVTIFDIRMRFMEPPGPLRQIGYRKV